MNDELIHKQLILTANHWYNDELFPNILSAQEYINPDDIKEYFQHSKLFPITEKSWLYIHIPFCKTQCLYCDITTKVEQRIEKFMQYILCLKRQAESQSLVHWSKIPVETIYIWWGTPSLLPIDLIRDLFQIIEDNYDIRNCIQITFEWSPYTLTKTYLEELKKLWVNRITMWVQTFEEDLLAAYNRPQIFKDTIQIINDAKNLWFLCVNVDLIAWLPWQTQSWFISTLKTLLSEARPTTFFAHAFQPTLRTPFNKLSKWYRKHHIQLRKRLFHIWNKLSQRLNSENYKPVYNFQLYDPSYSYKSIIWLWYWAISTIPWSVIYYWDNYKDYVDYYLNWSEKKCKWLLLKKNQIHYAFIIKSLMWNGIDKKKFQEIFSFNLLDCENFYKCLKNEGKNFLDNWSVIKFALISRVEKMRIFITYFYEDYPYNLFESEKIFEKCYKNLDVFYDY